MSVCASFYPLFPAPLAGPGVEALNLDVTHADLLKFGAMGADVVILPSALGKQFAKVSVVSRCSKSVRLIGTWQIVDSTVIVNPSYLTKGSTGGTFARFTIHPHAKAELQQEVGKAAMAAEETVIDHKIWERAKVDLIRV